ncbi:MAG: GlsB/YeaQ/YmgE family stress response membrane protein [Gemmatimonadota bacterium]
MDFIIGFIVWTVIGLIGGSVMMRAYRTAGTEPWLTVVFGFLGAFVGGMLGSSAHVFHGATPLRAGGLIGAVLGALFFSFLYHFIERKAV